MLLVPALSLLPHTVQNESYHLSMDENKFDDRHLDKVQGFPNSTTMLIIQRSGAKKVGLWLCTGQLTGRPCFEAIY